MKILMLVASDIAADARVLREASTLADAGHDITIIGKNVPDDFTRASGVDVRSVGSSPALKGASDSLVGRSHRIGQAARWLLLPHRRQMAARNWQRGARRLARTEHPDVVHAHDFSALGIGAEVARRESSRLVYDSHEYWPGRALAGRPEPIRRWLDQRRERRLGGHADVVVTVGDFVASLLREQYGWEPVVIRNTFPAFDDDPPRPDRPAGLIYAGRIGPHRELETLARAARGLEPFTVALMGDGDRSFIGGLEQTGLTVQDAVAVDEVDEQLRAAGIAFIGLAGDWLNHRAALPNKLFHAVRAGVPVVASDQDELRSVVLAHGIGELYRVGDADDLVRAARQVADQYDRYCESVRSARPALSWQRDGHVLVEMYEGLAQRPSTGAATGRQ